MLLPQANRVSPSTVLLRLSTTPSMCRRPTTSEAVALINTALTMKPKSANSWREKNKTKLESDENGTEHISPSQHEKKTLH